MSLLVLVAGLLLWEGTAFSGNQPSPHPYSGRKKVKDGLEAEYVPWLESLAGSWRHEYLLIHLSGHLFRRNDSESTPKTEDGHDSPAAYEEDHQLPPSFSSGAGETPCDGYCRVAGQFLQGGFYPEALARYRRAVEVRGPGLPDNLCPELGMLRVYLAMGRVPEAKAIRETLAASMDGDDDPFLILADGILACYTHDYASASKLFKKANFWWHLVPNLEAIIGYSQLRNREYAEAVTVFEAAEDSPFPMINQFAALGIADSLLALGRRMKAGGYYGRLVGAMSPMGLLAQAEFRLQGGYSESAEQALRSLLDSNGEDYWKGIALAYLIALKGDQGKWRECLGFLEDLKHLILSESWKAYFEDQTVNILAGVFGQLFQEGKYGEIVFLAEQWRHRIPDLPQAAQLTIAEAYRNLGLCVTASEMHRELPLAGDDLLQAGKAAWRCEQYSLAREMLDRLLQSDPSIPQDEVRLLLATALFHLDLVQEARPYLEGPRRGVDPDILVAVAKMEVSQGMLPEAKRDFHAALSGEGLSPAHRHDVLGNLAALYYRMGLFAKAVAYFQMREEMAPSGEAVKMEPMEILSLLNLDQHEQAREESEKRSGDPQAEVFVKEIFSTEDAVNELKRNGYAF